MGRNNQIVFSLLSQDVFEAVIGAIFEGHIDQQDVSPPDAGFNTRDQHNTPCSRIRLELGAVRQRIVIGYGQGIETS